MEYTSNPACSYLLSIWSSQSHDGMVRIKNILRRTHFRDNVKGRFCSTLNSGNPTDVCQPINRGCFKGETVLQPRFEDVWIQALSVHLKVLGFILYPCCEHVWIQVFTCPCERVRIHVSSKPNSYPMDNSEVCLSVYVIHIEYFPLLMLKIRCKRHYKYWYCHLYRHFIMYFNTESSWVQRNGAFPTFLATFPTAVIQNAKYNYVHFASVFLVLYLELLNWQKGFGKNCPKITMMASRVI